ncbi:protein SEH1 isoform X2 [Morus notabilis]|uniref:protein SEH1 isoform X2 n=1 Tax=Morus notabilis TaxID=981085 RepID=UPI000CED6004|nr:protein SEH1 isoform X2 [Morus notabilis]
MEKSLVDLENGTTCSSWNYSGQRLAAGSADGFLSIFDARDSASSSFTRSSKSRVHDTGIVKVVWIPPEYGDAVACVCADGTLSLWEEVVEDAQPLQWKLCKSFKSNSSQVLDVQFGVSLSGLKMVAAYSDGHIRVYELLDPLELKNWQLQVWEFDQAHQRWLPVAELALPGNKGDQVYSVAWAPNIGRPYEVIAVATHKAIALWHLGLIPDTDGRLSVEQVALLSGHAGEMWQMEWDMSGMTLATSGSDGKVRLWQSNLNGVWHEQAALEPTT